ncbi:hypothetical protein [Deinococcus ficus]|uniref:hypothetical protein n=1 Tax=Deinococcus ficus TaxID=317577 RepID=UPI00131C75D5|nr:hypothetical protein [Deinococcus ficus]
MQGATPEDKVPGRANENVIRVRIKRKVLSIRVEDDAVVEDFGRSINNHGSLTGEHLPIDLKDEFFGGRYTDHCVAISSQYDGAGADGG